MEGQIIIVVQCTNEQPYKSLIPAQKSTWDSIGVSGVSTYYLFTDEGNYIAGDLMLVECSSDPLMQNYKAKLAMELLDKYSYSFLVFATNDTYIDKKKLKEYLMYKKSYSFYAGCIIENLQTGGYVAGSFIVLSKDCVNILIGNITDEPDNSGDFMVGKILNEYNVTPKQIDVQFIEEHHEVVDAIAYKSEVHPDNIESHNRIMNKIHSFKIETDEKE